jgi:hypothetical protein
MKKQNGAVLAFSLVMLLLLTLAGTRMIQQNKQQLEMANNARLLTQAFADGEGFLADVKNTINISEAHDNYYGLPIDDIEKCKELYFEPYFDPIDPNINGCLKLEKTKPNGTMLPINNKQHQCKPILFKKNTDDKGTFKQNIGLAQAINSTQIILSVRCFGLKDSEGNVRIQECSSYDETTGKVTCNGNTDCKTVDDAIAAFSASDICYQDYDPQVKYPDETAPIVTGKCPKEVYTIKAISTDTYGTTREIISDHVVGCGG